MKKITVEEFNKIPINRRVAVYAPDICNKPMEGRISESYGLKNHYVQLDNGDEIFASEIKGIWGIDKNGNREEL